MKDRYAHAKKVLSSRPYRVIVWPLSLLYLVAVAGTYLYIYNGDLRGFYHGFPVWFTITTTVLNVLISLMVGIAITLFVAKIRELRLKSAGVGALGIMFGALAAGCPGCFFGLFSAFLGLFGITATLAILPLNGIEFQLLTVLLMGVSIFLLAEETDLSCRLKK